MIKSESSSMSFCFGGVKAETDTCFDSKNEAQTLSSDSNGSRVFCDDMDNDAQNTLYVADDSMTTKETSSKSFSQFGEERNKITTCLGPAKDALLLMADVPAMSPDSPSCQSSASTKDSRCLPLKVFSCGRCSYETDRKNNLKRHVTTMHDPAPATLDCCGTSFATKGDLRDHTRSAHGGGYTCWQCGHTFCRRALLHRHQSVHSGLKAFSCSKCGYQSSHKSNMQRHMQVHLQMKSATVSGLSASRLKDKLKINKSAFASKFSLSSMKNNACQSVMGKNAFASQCFAEIICKKTNLSPNYPIDLKYQDATFGDAKTSDNLNNFMCKSLSFNDNTFSRALTTLKSHHLSQARMDQDELKDNLKSFNRPLPTNVSPDSTSSDYKVLNQNAWKLAFSKYNNISANHRHLSMQYKSDTSVQRIQSSPDTNCISSSSFSSIHPNISHAPALSVSHDCCFPSSTHNWQENTTAAPLAASPLASSYHIPPTVKPLSESFRLPGSLCTPSSRGFLPVRQNCRKTSLPKPIPTYRRIVTDFSVNSLLGRRSPDQTSAADNNSRTEFVELVTGSIMGASSSPTALGSSHFPYAYGEAKHLPSAFVPKMPHHDTSGAPCPPAPRWTSTVSLGKNSVPASETSRVMESHFLSSGEQVFSATSANTSLHLNKHNGKGKLFSDIYKTKECQAASKDFAELYFRIPKAEVSDAFASTQAEYCSNLPLDCSMPKVNLSTESKESPVCVSVACNRMGLDNFESLVTFDKNTQCSRGIPTACTDGPPSQPVQPLVDAELYVPKKIRALNRVLC